MGASRSEARSEVLSADERERIGTWLAEHGVGHGPLTSLSRLSGGTQNIMLKVERGGRMLVARRGPEHLRPQTNAHLRREARMLAALAGTGVPHARLVAFCDDEEVWSGSYFYVMEYVDGFNATLELPGACATDPTLRHAMGLSVAEGLAKLGEVDPGAAGLGDVGKPEGFLKRQVPRWLAEYDSLREFDGYHEPRHPAVDLMAEWLEAHTPEQPRPGIMHGDFHLANVMFSLDRPVVSAIIDWEMSTVADPLLDLGWLIAMWPESHAGLAGGVLGRAGGLPGEAELAARYAEVSTRSVDNLPWYVVLACFKLGVLLEGTHARACAGLAPRETGDRLHATSLRLFEQGALRVQATR